MRAASILLIATILAVPHLASAQTRSAQSLPQATPGAFSASVPARTSSPIPGEAERLGSTTVFLAIPTLLTLAILLYLVGENGDTPLPDSPG